VRSARILSSWILRATAIVALGSTACATAPPRAPLEGARGRTEAAAEVAALGSKSSTLASAWANGANEALPNATVDADDATGHPSAQPIAPEVMLDEVRVPRDKPVLVVRGRGSRVIVYLHGRCGEPERLRAWAAAASTFGTVIALRGEVRCRDGVRARWTEDVATIDRRITAAIRAVGANHPEPLDANARVVFGYSQGALRAESLASRFPERYPLVVLAAGPRGPRADALAKVRRAVVVAGELDVRAPLAKGADELLRRGVPTRYVVLPGARHGEFGPEAVPRLEAALTWLVDAGGDAPHTAHLAPL
jgi:pimeloyl-ACP methyl ester carboxylesterase